MLALNALAVQVTPAASTMFDAPSVTVANGPLPFAW
jgi:hypothetical protein